MHAVAPLPPRLQRVGEAVLTRPAIASLYQKQIHSAAGEPTDFGNAAEQQPAAEAGALRSRPLAHKGQWLRRNEGIRLKAPLHGPETRCGRRTRGKSI